MPPHYRKRGDIWRSRRFSSRRAQHLSGARILTGCTSKIGAEAVGAHPFEGGLPRTRSNNQLPPQRCYRTFNRAQTDDDVLLSRQFLAYLICVARVETKTLTQPVRQVIELFRPRRRSIRTPLTSRQPVTRRPRRTAELDGNSLRPPSCGLQPQHGRDIARGLHRVPSAVRSVLLAYSRAKLSWDENTYKEVTRASDTGGANLLSSAAMASSAMDESRSNPNLPIP